MKTVFLDANILFSAAYSEQAALLRIWKLRSVILHTSAYALEEARRNLRDEQSLARLKRLIEGLSLVPEADTRFIPSSVILREKDKPILAAAIAARAQYLVTGDSRDFGTFFGKTVAGLMVLPPRDFLGVMESTQK